MLRQGDIEGAAGHGLGRTDKRGGGDLPEAGPAKCLQAVCPQEASAQPCEAEQPQVTEGGHEGSEQD